MQKTKEWFDIRIGKFTGSNIVRLMSDPKSKKGFSDGATTYIYEKASERITGEAEDSFSNESTEWGEFAEPKAAIIYELQTGKKLEEVGFIENKEIPWFGASPDGIVKDERGIEIKCPTKRSIALKLYTCDNEKDVLSISPKYYYQCHAGMLATGLPFWDLVIFEPRLYDIYALKIITFYRDEGICKEITQRVINANKKVEEIIESIKVIHP